MKHDRPNSTQNRHQKRQGWKFSFFGETPQPPVEEIAPADKAAFALTRAPLNTPLWIAGFQDKDGVNRLASLGLAMGAEIQVISSQPSGSVVIALQDSRLGLDAGMARKILARDVPHRFAEGAFNPQQHNRDMEPEIIMQLRDMTPGTSGRVIGYERALSGYKGKLLSMGLTPGTEFMVIRVAPLGDPIEINVRGFNLSLRKQEADALIVEEVSNNVC